jgi:hypothetical protein
MTLNSFRRSPAVRLAIAAALVVGTVACELPATPDPVVPPPRADNTASVSVALAGGVLSSQQASLWCWAATISNLFSHYGHPVSQARIVAEVYGVPVNARSGDYANLARLLNRTWRDDRGVLFTARLNAALDVPNGVDSITNDQIRSALRSNRPLVVGTTTHAMLMVGMTYQDMNGLVGTVRAVRVFDPWPGVGLRELNASEMTPLPRGGTLMFIADATIS